MNDELEILLHEYAALSDELDAMESIYSVFPEPSEQLDKWNLIFDKRIDIERRLKSCAESLSITLNYDGLVYYVSE